MRVFIGRHHALSVQLTQRHVQLPLAFAGRLQTVRCQIDTLANADAGGASEQQGVGQ